MEKQEWMISPEGILVTLIAIYVVGGLIGYLCWRFGGWFTKKSEPLPENLPQIEFVIIGFDKPLDQVEMQLPFVDNVRSGWGEKVGEDWVAYSISDEEELGLTEATRILVGKIHAVREAFSRACGSFKCQLNCTFKNEEALGSFFLSEEVLRNLGDLGATIGISVKTNPAS